MAIHTTAADAKYYFSGQSVDYFKNIHDGLLAVGLTKTSDTGQLDLTTAPTVVLSSANYDYGYSMFQFTDAFQSEYPIFVKVRYTNDAWGSTATRVVVRLEVGEGTNGSGTLTGKVDDRFTANVNSIFSNQTTLSTNNISFKDGTLVIATAITATSGTIEGITRRVIAVGRRKDMSGSFTKGIYKVQIIPSNTTATTTITTIEESHITEYKTTVGVFNHGANNATLNRSSILNPYHWITETDSIVYSNSQPILPLYVLTPVPEYIPGVVATGIGVGFNESFTADFDGTKTFLGTNGRPNGDTLIRLGYIWE
jgi:hypothetical protein